jgi:hypothetical protein
MGLVLLRIRKQLEAELLKAGMLNEPFRNGKRARNLFRPMGMGLGKSGIKLYFFNDLNADGISTV